MQMFFGWIKKLLVSFFLRYFIKLQTLTSPCHSLSLTLSLVPVPVPVPVPAAAKPSACPQGPVNPEACTLPPCAWLMLTVSVPKNRHSVHLLEESI